MVVEKDGQRMSFEVEAFNNNAKTLVEFSMIQARRLPIAEIGERFFTLFQERLDACQTKEQFQRLDTDASYVELYDSQRQNPLLKPRTFWERVESELSHRSDEDAIRVYGLKQKALETFAVKAKPLFQSDLDALVTVDGINQYSDSLGVILTEALQSDIRGRSNEIIPQELDGITSPVELYKKLNSVLKATGYSNVDKTLEMIDERIAQRIDQIPDEELSPEVLNNLIAELKLDGRDYGQNVRLFKKVHWSLDERIGKFYPPVTETINTENELNALVDKMGKYSARAVMYLLYRAAAKLYSPLIDACDSVDALRALRRRVEDKIYIAGIEGKINGQTHRIYDALIRQQQDIESLRQFKTGLDSVEKEILDDSLTVQLITIMQPRIDAAADSSGVESLYAALQKEERNILERYIYGKIRSFWQEPVEQSESFQELTKLNLQLSAFESPVVKGLFQAKAKKMVEHYTQEAVSFEEFLQQEREFEQFIDLIGDSPLHKGGSGFPAGTADHYYFQPQLMQKRQELFKEYIELNSRGYADLDRFIGSLPVLTRVSLNEQIKEARISLLRNEASRCDSLTQYEQIGRWMDEIGLGSRTIYWQGNPLYDLMLDYNRARERVTA